MRLNKLLMYNDIVIQSHDNPDADSLASGYALYCYFKSHGKNVRFIYSGRYKIQKSNLLLMIQELDIPIEYVEDKLQIELLITVDCQYGTGNVTTHEAKNIVIIDHHQLEIDPKKYADSDVQNYLGCCSTIVWQLLLNEQYDVNANTNVATALFYGLYTDTGQLAEIFHPLDRDMRDSLHYEQSLITKLRNSNISLDELEIAGLALLRYIHNDKYRFAVIKVKPCDPNILGLISDFLLQVDTIDTCVVFNELQDGIKLSVRSCIKEVKACELASYLTNVIGSGGGHKEKAGGFIQRQLFEDRYHSMSLEAYFTERMNEYFNNFEVIDAETYKIDISKMKFYRKTKVTIGYLRLADVISVDTPVLIRTEDDDIELTVREDLYIVVGLYGEVYVMDKEKFDATYQPIDARVNYLAKYMPVANNLLNGTKLELTKYAKACISRTEQCIYARQLTIETKVFSIWDTDTYMLGHIGDYIAVNENDERDIFIIDKDIFSLSYKESKLLCSKDTLR